VLKLATILTSALNPSSSVPKMARFIISSSICSGADAVTLKAGFSAFPSHFCKATWILHMPPPIIEVCPKPKKRLAPFFFLPTAYASGFFCLGLPSVGSLYIRLEWVFV